MYNPKNFRPCLAPNNKVGTIDINWNERILYPGEWYISEKLDDIRAEIIITNGVCEIKTRNMKLFGSILVNEWAQKITDLKIKVDMILDAAIYCRGMRFNELQHFILSDDVENPNKFKKIKREINDGRFPDRSFEWLTSYNHDFRMYVFDIANQYSTFGARWLYEIPAAMQFFSRLPFMGTVTQRNFESVEAILNFYETVVEEGGEGIVLKHYSHRYKLGRNTLKEGVYFKMKDEAHEFTATIMDVLEGTVVDEYADVTINELGYSTTSKLSADRNPSGKAKGFHVIMDDGRELTVTLSGYTDNDKINLLKSKQLYIGKELKFIGMPATKIGGVPRQAKTIKNNK